MAPAPAACVMAPASEIVPLAVIPRVPEPIEDVPSTKLIPFTSETLFAPVFVSETAPVKAFDCESVMAKPPVVKLEVPGTVNTVLLFCVIAPPAVIDNAPLLFKVRVGKAIAAALKLKVKLRNPVNDPRPLGTEAEAFEFVRLKS